MSRALALVAPPEPSLPPDTRLLGLPLVRRTVLSARRAGFSDVTVVGAPAEIRAALEGTPARTAASVPSGAVALPWNAVVTIRDLEALRDGAPDAGVAVRSRADLPQGPAEIRG